MSMVNSWFVPVKKTIDFEKWKDFYNSSSVQPICNYGNEVPTLNLLVPLRNRFMEHLSTTGITSLKKSASLLLEKLHKTLIAEINWETLASIDSVIGESFEYLFVTLRKNRRNFLLLLKNYLLRAIIMLFQFVLSGGERIGMKMHRLSNIIRFFRECVIITSENFSIFLFCILDIMGHQCFTLSFIDILIKSGIAELVRFFLFRNLCFLKDIDHVSIAKTSLFFLSIPDKRLKMNQIQNCTDLLRYLAKFSFFFLDRCCIEQGICIVPAINGVLDAVPDHIILEQLIVSDLDWSNLEYLFEAAPVTMHRVVSLLCCEELNIAPILPLVKRFGEFCPLPLRLENQKYISAFLSSAEVHGCASSDLVLLLESVKNKKLKANIIKMLRSQNTDVHIDHAVHLSQLGVPHVLPGLDYTIMTEYFKDNPMEFIAIHSHDKHSIVTKYNIIEFFKATAVPVTALEGCGINWSSIVEAMIDKIKN
ncbi:hypothetical protein PCE1_004218 [Barthelona sp. PCE]